MFHMRLYVVCISLVRNKTFLHPFISTIQDIIHVGLFTIIIPNVCASAYEVLNEFGILFLCQFGSLCIFFIKFLLFFDC